MKDRPLWRKLAMLKSNRGNFVVLAFCLWLLVGCTPTQIPEKAQETVLTYPAFSESVHIKTLSVNPLDFEYTEVFPSVSGLKISGLKNKVVESQINMLIESNIQEMIDLAEGRNTLSVRGAEKHLPLGTVLNNYYIGANVTCNYNHVLSIEIYLGANFQNKWFSLSKGLTFDLNSGELIPFEALFKDDVDIDDLISPILLKEIYELQMFSSGFSSAYTLEWIKPYKGLPENPDYVLSDTNFTLYLNEKFDALYSPSLNATRILMSYSQVSPDFVVFNRYYDPGALLFESETTERILSLPYEFAYSEFGGEKFSVSVPKNFPENVLEHISHLAEDKTTHLSEKYGHVSAYASRQFDSYVSVSFLINTEVEDGYYWEEVYLILDEGLKPVPIDVFFVEPLDYKSLLKALLLEALKDPYYASVDAETLDFDDWLSKSSYRLTKSGFQFAFKPVKSMYGDYTPITIEVPYSALGYDQLTLFKD